jgi:hypothetical protein
MTVQIGRIARARNLRRSPDVEAELGLFPSKDAAMPAFGEAIAKHDPLRAAIEPVEAEATPENALMPWPARAGARWIARPGSGIVS